MTLERSDVLPGKGTTRCNRTACQIELAVGLRRWNTATRAWYCLHCATQINRSAMQSGSNPYCVPEEHPDAPKPAPIVPT